MMERPVHCHVCRVELGVERTTPEGRSLFHPSGAQHGLHAALGDCHKCGAPWSWQNQQGRRMYAQLRRASQERSTA